MKKIVIGAALVVGGILMASAQVQGSVGVQVQGGPQVKMEMKSDIKGKMVDQKMGSSTRPVMGTSTRPMMGTSTRPVITEEMKAKVKALNVEMEAKVKALRDEYQLKIQAILGTSTMPMMRDGEGEGRPPMNGSSTNGGPRPMMGGNGQVKGVMTTDASIEMKTNIVNFFKGLFGGR